MTPGPAPRPVQRRRVYYFAGFDTRGARSYHQLYQTEAARQQAISGRHYTVGPAETSGDQTTDWAVTGQEDNSPPVHTRYRFMAWNNIIRSYWPAAVWRVLLTMPAFYWRFTGCGAMGRTRQLWRPFYWMVMLPLWMTLAGLALGGLAAAAVGWAGPGRLLPLAAPQQALLSALAAAAVGLAVVALVLQRAEQWRVFWLMRAWHFLWDWSGRRIPALEKRLDAFADAIQHDLEQEAAAAPGSPPADEVLLIGHSAGALSALAVAARWLDRCGPNRPPQVKLVTLGQVHPFLGLIPQAGWYRAQLQQVAASGMTWVDLSAPADPLCYALVDPLAACGFAPAPANFLAKSSRFDRMFSPERYAELRRDFFRIHFQYLMASDKPVDNDYFQLTAGPRPLDLARLAPQPAA